MSVSAHTVRAFLRAQCEGWLETGACRVIGCLRRILSACVMFIMTTVVPNFLLIYITKLGLTV